MTDDLDIQRVLKDRLDPVQTHGSIPAEVVRKAKKRRVLFTSLISGGLVLILGGTGVLGASLLRGENTIAPVAPIETATPPDCPPVAEGGYEARVAPAAGPTESEVTISGPVPLYGEDGSYKGPGDAIEFWWNADPNQPETLLSFRSGGPEPVPANPEENVVRLGSIDPESHCTFEFQFEVPDASPGDYPIAVLQYGGGGGGLYDDAQFQVTETGQPFRLRTHCGLSVPLEFRNRFWLPVDPNRRQTHNPPEGFGGDENYDEGTIRVVDQDTIIYTSSNGVEVEYEPTNRRPGRCE